MGRAAARMPWGRALSDNRKEPAPRESVPVEPSRPNPIWKAEFAWRSFARGDRLDGQSVDPVAHQVAQGGIDGALAGYAVLAGEGRAFDGQGEMAFAAAVVAGVADVMVALVFESETGRGKGRFEAADHLGGDGAVGGAVHLFYIKR